ncbi:MAG: tyrosyl-tRNA synthetase [Parcubacteria group bacterium Gr01-1014_33]|nr:MAG: tyrosyl-tRNA synthetase [Parcubacteria group bacterium Gr01-1014_33]
MAKIDSQSEVLTRAVEEVIIREHLEHALASGKKLRVKFGIDPTAPDLHLGHTVPLGKLRAFQELGHQAVLIIGDFTATVGDPSGRSEARRPLTEKEIKANMRQYLTQVGKILDVKKAEVRYNSEWYKKAGVAFLYDLLSKVTIQRALERDDFQKRIREEQDISILEVVYPVLQGYDSVAVGADVEIGGTDQKFNLLMGRRVQRKFGYKEQDIVTTWLIEGLDGGRKMSKSLGNYIGLLEPPDQMFGKIMSIPDSLIVKYFIALTSGSLKEIAAMEKEMRLNLNPRDAKLTLAKTIVGEYHDATIARREYERFLKVFSKRELPDDIAVREVTGGKKRISALLVEMRLVRSKSEGFRKVKEGAVEINGRRVENPNEEQEAKTGDIVRMGRRFAKVKIME